MRLTAPDAYMALVPQVEKETGIHVETARGEAEVGFQQMSELLSIPGITIVGSIPDEGQKITRFSALASPAACAAVRDAGLDPVACSQDADVPESGRNR